MELCVCDTLVIISPVSSLGFCGLIQCVLFNKVERLTDRILSHLACTLIWTALSLSGCTECMELATIDCQKQKLPQTDYATS